MKNHSPNITFRYKRKEEAKKKAKERGKNLSEVIKSGLDFFLDN